MADIKGVRELRARFEAITPDADLMRDLALHAVAGQKALVPRRTGNLGRSIHIASVTPTTAEIIASADYAAHVEFGTRPHEIRPRNKKALRFAASGADARLTGTPRTGGNVRFAKRVQHPGTRAQPFMVPGAQKALAAVGLAARLIDNWNDAA